MTELIRLVIFIFDCAIALYECVSYAAACFRNVELCMDTDRLVLLRQNCEKSCGWSCMEQWIYTPTQFEYFHYCLHWITGCPYVRWPVAFMDECVPLIILGIQIIVCIRNSARSWSDRRTANRKQFVFNWLREIRWVLIRWIACAAEGAIFPYPASFANGVDNRKWLYALIGGPSKRCFVYLESNAI